MPQITDGFDLGRLALASGEGRRLELAVRLDDLQFAGERYAVRPDPVAVTLDLARTTGPGWSLRVRFEAAVVGPCMRCLRDASPVFRVDAREIEQPGGGEELTSPYVDGEVLDLRAWARDALALSIPAQIVCRESCRGLCPVCGTDLEEAGPEHHHQRAPDPRWAKLRELELGSG